MRSYGYFQVRSNYRGCSSLIILPSQTNNSYFICDDPAIINKIFARLRHYDNQVDLHDYWAYVYQSSYDITGNGYKPKLPAEHRWSSDHEHL